MSSKSQILKSIRHSAPPAAELPPLAGTGVEYPDPTGQFVEVLTAIGGTVIQAENPAAIQQHLETLDVYRDATRVLSTIDGVGRSNVELDAIEDPRELMNLDIAILPGELAVAENGAVWTQPGELKHRVAYFLAEHLMLVVPADRVVSGWPEPSSYSNDWASPAGFTTSPASSARARTSGWQ